MRVYDIEEQIMQTWSIVDQIKFYSETNLDGKSKDMIDSLCNLLDMRFSKLMDTYEQYLKERNA